MASIKDSDDGEHTELHIDGKFQAGWTRLDFTDLQRGVIANMIECAVKYGERKKAEEIRKVIGAK